MTSEQYKAMLAGRSPRKSKYGNRKVEYDGRTFDSERERDRYAELRILERAGKISDLRCQRAFELIPVQRDHNGRILEKPLTYIADFTYSKDGELIVEDAKGFRTKEYKIKKKLMLYFHGIRIREV